MLEKIERVKIAEPNELSSTPSSTKSSATENIFLVLSILLVIICPLLLIACFRVVKQYKRAVVLRFGKVRPDTPAGPGVIWVLPLSDEVTLIDLRTQSFNLPPQQILTKDSVTVTVDAVGYFHVTEPLHCLLNVQYYRHSTELTTIAVLRNVLGQYTLGDALTSRQSMSARTKFEIDAIISDWGIHIERVEILILVYRDMTAVVASIRYRVTNNTTNRRIRTQYRVEIKTRSFPRYQTASVFTAWRYSQLITLIHQCPAIHHLKNILLPFDLQQAMAVEAEATRIAKAKLIEASGEIQAAVNLREASRIIMENPQIMLLRYLQSLNSIASRQKTSIIFPFPIQIPEPLEPDQYPNTVHQNTTELLNRLKSELEIDATLPEGLLEGVSTGRNEIIA